MFAPFCLTCINLFYEIVNWCIIEINSYGTHNEQHIVQHIEIYGTVIYIIDWGSNLKSDRPTN